MRNGTKSISDDARETVGTSAVATAHDTFSSLDLRDRVVIMALFYQMVGFEHVEKAWKTSRQRLRTGTEEALWRVLARDPDLNPDPLYEMAAQIHGVEHAVINRLKALALIEKIAATFSQGQWQQMVKYLVVPVAVGEDPRNSEARLIFATHDPTRPEVTRLLRGFNLNGFDLRYASSSELMALLTEAFPRAALPRRAPASDDAGPVARTSPSTVEEGRKPTDLDHTSLVGWFESVLVAAYRYNVREVHITPTAARRLEIHFHLDGRLQLWHEEDAFRPEGLRAYIIDDIINGDDGEPGVALETNLQRWIDGTLTRFHIVLPPASDHRSAETVVVRVLGRREASGEQQPSGPPSHAEAGPDEPPRAHP